eukprot:1137045-Pelagomonas_calceolata.AAC.3
MRLHSCNSLKGMHAQAVLSIYNGQRRTQDTMASRRAAWDIVESQQAHALVNKKVKGECV